MSFHRLRVLFIATIILFSACTLSSSTEHSDLLTALAEINGSYHWNSQLKRYVFSEKLAIEKILSPKDSEFVIRALVDCLDNLTSSNSTIRNETVVLGFICYEALSQTAYHESTTETGDIAESWPGHILPAATPSELIKAKHAWKNVIESKTYIFF